MPCMEGSFEERELLRQLIDVDAVAAIVATSHGLQRAPRVAVRAAA